MQTPQRISTAQYIEFTHNALNMINSAHCTKCGEELESTLAHLSLHSKLFDACAGSGKVITVTIPFCRRCEATPAVSGCIHI